MYYTLGQRKGLGIGGLKESDEEPWYVVEKDLLKNRLIVAQGHDHPAMLHNRLETNQINWINDSAADPDQNISITAKIRYRQSDQKCTLNKIDETKYVVDFDDMQRAITPGQSIVFYQDDICLGGGVIETMSKR